MKTLIIAEAGVNHNGDLNLAKELVKSAALAGADIVKFQTFNADNIVTKTAPKATYQLGSTGQHESQYSMLKKLELTAQMHELLIEECHQNRIAFLSTAFDEPSIDLLVNLGLDKFKIPSGEITNLPYLRRIGQYGKSIILSSGMASLGEIEQALEVLIRAGTSLENITVLHCNTEYPTPMIDVNLRAMVTIKEAFGVSIGYSDHTLGIEVSIAAVALGASIIEKHFTLDKSMPGPDHHMSLNPNELAEMVKAIRNIGLALGDSRKISSPSEKKNQSFVRKSIVAAKAINAGEVFSEHNLTVKRPGNGISPMNWDNIIGKIALRPYVQDELID